MKAYEHEACGGRIIFVATATHERRIFLVGKCVKCGAGTKMDIEVIVKDALEPEVGFKTDLVMPPDTNKN